MNTREGQQLKNGAYPLICELTGNGKQKSFSLKMKFLDEEWNYEKQEPKKDKVKILIVRRKKSLLDNLLIKSIDDPKITDHSHLL
ncbi:Arm DNA-binding domain-containing protein [Tenacibaculum maritimum]|uniref:Arm DNA-binding domain-containing protein n=1 Tax=Tenacibaculum maritimum TaxID=107401 RepID=UPI001F18E826|nr:Arm DNA-binding domain-containing protein [Tenacibaculum maritimum]